MKTKLTLSIDPQVVARAKEEAQRRGTSVSDMVETYLSVVSKPDEPRKTIEITPLVKSFSGKVHIEEGVDPREEYGDYLIKKYVHD